MRLRAPALAIALASVATAASAYILPAEAILGSIARRREGLAFKSLIVEGTRRRAVSGATLGPEEPVWEAIIPGGAHRRELRGEGGTTVTLTLGKKRSTWREGEKAETVIIKPDPIVAFLAQTSAESRVEGRGLLEAYRIDPEVVSLSRLDRAVAYVIGAKPWETDRPQLWVDKSYRLPVRLIEIDPKTKDVIDTRYTGYGSAQTGEWWPRKIEVFKNGALVETTTYTDAQVNEPIEPALFKPPAG